MNITNLPKGYIQIEGYLMWVDVNEIARVGYINSQYWDDVKGVVSYETVTVNPSWFMAKFFNKKPKEVKKEVEFEFLIRKPTVIIRFKDGKFLEIEHNTKIEAQEYIERLMFVINLEK